VTDLITKYRKKDKSVKSVVTDVITKEKMIHV